MILYQIPGYKFYKVADKYKKIILKLADDVRIINNMITSEKEKSCALGNAVAKVLDLTYLLSN